LVLADLTGADGACFFAWLETRASIVVTMGSRVSGLRHLGAPTTRSPAFREANPENSAPQLTDARHTTNASFAAEVEG
jgi:hypothetical protein